MTTMKKYVQAWAMPQLSLKIQTAAAMVAVVAAVVLPQMIHIIGKTAGSGSALGEMLLPMHLPIILVGLLAGPYAGLIAGILAPVISYALTGMPMSQMLPFITIEVAVYGLCAGVLRGRNGLTFIKVLMTQIAGRTVRGATILVSVFVLGNSAVNPVVILSSIKTGMVGILLQWVLIAAIMYGVRKASANE